ncbi:transcription initiation factor IIE, beta subunit [Piedraia hortae CBS 480.64]|uniref:Transcription initiation factor IIE, beta subunit n=1 Tax=Piedraia hortae CBS 480.64 TaxID=1314780 RepID=A0A6A7BYS6_9PEZI|nr:transcription initiation factor IIE, beta subunit [Piedraia hortae CBS 480.64]
MPNLSTSLSQFQAERSATVSRNISHSRPVQPSTSSGVSRPTPLKPTTTRPLTKPPARPITDLNLLRHSNQILEYLKKHNGTSVTYARLIEYLSLSHDVLAREYLLHKAIAANSRVIYTPSPAFREAGDLFEYKPIHPVRNEAELLAYLPTLETAAGVTVKDLKDGWEDCVPVLERLEGEGRVLMLRHKKDNSPRVIWRDEPGYYLDGVRRADTEFVEAWMRVKLPTDEALMREELVNAGLTPTSAVKEVIVQKEKKKPRKRVEWKNGKRTNVHLSGVLKDYSKMKK